MAWMPPDPSGAASAGFIAGGRRNAEFEGLPEAPFGFFRDAAEIQQVGIFPRGLVNNVVFHIEFLSVRRVAATIRQVEYNINQ